MIKEVREFYGISQELFAAYLGITRSHLSMAEIGKRDISGKANIIVSHLYLALLQSKEATADAKLKSSLQEQKKKLTDKADKLLRNREYYLTRAKMNLEELQSGQVKSTKIIDSLTTLMQSDKLQDKRMMEIINIQARRMQDNTSEVYQLELQLKIRGLEAEIEYLKDLRSSLY